MTRLSFKDAAKRMRDKPDTKLFFFFCEQDAQGKPVMIADTSKIDLSKDKEVLGVLATAKLKGSIGGSMTMAGTALQLKPQGSKLSSTKLAKGVEVAVRQSNIGGIVEAVNVGEPEAEDLREKGLGAEFEGETEGLSFRTQDKDKRADPRWVTEYAKDPADSKASVQDGLLKDAKGVGVDGKKGFVVDPKTGAVHLFDQIVEVENIKTKVRRPATKDDTDIKKLAPDERLVAVHHSSPLGGQAVGGAGEIVADKGAVRRVTDQSGHYEPEADLTHQSVASLKQQGAKLVDDEVVGMGKKGKPREATPEEKLELQKLLAFRKQLKLADNTSLVEMQTKLKAEKKSPNAQLDAMVKLEQKLRQGGVGASQKQAVVELGGKGLSADEFEAVRGNRDKLNKLLEARYGVRNAVDASVDAEVLDNLLKLNNHLRKSMAKVELGAEQFLQTGGGERAIRQKAVATQGLGKTIDEETWEAIKGDLAKVNQEIRRRVGLRDLLPGKLSPEDLKKLLSNRIMVNALIAKKAPAQGEERDYGMPDGWDAVPPPDDANAAKLLGVGAGDLKTWVEDWRYAGGAENTNERLAQELGLSLEALYEKLNPKKT